MFAKFAVKLLKHAIKQMPIVSAHVSVIMNFIKLKIKNVNALSAAKFLRQKLQKIYTVVGNVIIKIDIRQKVNNTIIGKAELQAKMKNYANLISIKNGSRQYTKGISINAKYVVVK